MWGVTWKVYGWRVYNLGVSGIAIGVYDDEFKCRCMVYSLGFRVRRFRFSDSG